MLINTISCTGSTLHPFSRHHHAALQIEQLQSQCCQLEKELARKQGDADVFRREAENKLAERMRVALREQQLEYESQVSGVCVTDYNVAHRLPNRASKEHHVQSLALAHAQVGAHV